ncbi:unnamed protein product [Heligmosomoides polygyrus]|uniref:ANF_receptor domain-containing protein n=1 Tax=Heligmosomoides polygyrus TaxID=6339 RepID=A0A183GD77_HELPZ|nr:unnamed protein product [Heligmosomoides polygyrus]
MIVSVIFSLLSSTVSQQKRTVVVGIAAVEEVLPEFMAFSLSGGAIGIALDRMQAEGISQGFDFRFIVNYTECSAQRAVGVALQFMVEENVDVIIAPPCPAPAELMGHLSTYYKKTLLGWGFLTDSRFSNEEDFPYLTKVVPDSLQMMYGVLQVFELFDWNRIAIYYTPDEVNYCNGIIDDAMVRLSLRLVEIGVLPLHLHPDSVCCFDIRRERRADCGMGFPG